MQTFKTAVVVVLMLIVLWGVYQVVVNSGAELDPPPEVAWIEEEEGEMKPPQIDFGSPLLENAPGEDDGMELPDHLQEYGGGAFAGPPHEHEGTDDVSENAAPGPAPELPDNAFPTDSNPPPPSSVDPGQAQPTAPGVIQNPYVGSSAPPFGANADTADRASTPGDSDPSSGSSADPALGSIAFQRAWADSQNHIRDGDYHEALATLSVFYGSPDLTAEEHDQLLEILDPLAGKVIYSREHLVEPPYRVRRNETLMDVAEQMDVPWELLQNINGVDNPQVLLPGQTIKVVRGPFRADVNTTTGELTLFLDDLYAGRFPVAVGEDPAPEPGEYHIRDKQTRRAYYALDGRTIPAGSPNNPYGDAWLDLGRQMCIHGSPAADVPAADGCIGLSPRDARDLYNILSVGSRVRILR